MAVVKYGVVWSITSKDTITAHAEVTSWVGVHATVSSEGADPEVEGFSGRCIDLLSLHISPL